MELMILGRLKHIKTTAKPSLSQYTSCEIEISANSCKIITRHVINKLSRAGSQTLLSQIHKTYSIYLE
jgi:hypothetical protein